MPQDLIPEHIPEIAACGFHVGEMTLQRLPDCVYHPVIQTYYVRTVDELVFEVEAESEAEAREKAPAEEQANIVEVFEAGTPRPIFINGNRSGYSFDSCGQTMTVGELIAFLSDFDENRPIYLRNDNGYTYGNITSRDIMGPEDM